MEILKPIKPLRQYDKIISDKIIEWLWVTFFEGCFKILESKTVQNDSDIIRSALENGQIFYQGNGFYSVTGRFRNELARELEKIGARYSKYRKAYLIEKSKLPTEILWAIDTVKATLSQKTALLQGYLTYQLANLSKETEKLVFDTAVDQILQDLQERVYKNAQAQKIELITPKLTDFKANEIAKNYTNNLDYWVKNWTEDRIIKMRETVGQMSIDGKSVKTIAEYIQKEFGISQRHAKFLARNESAMATTSYLEAKYKEEGFSSFKWYTNLDGRERPLHKQLHGGIFRFDDPPIIDERTGEKGLPAQTYNCRCTFTPVVDKEFLENRKALYKAQNSFFNKVKDFINGKN
ncbi:MAG: minor capsid protein [Alphaproteobacteria bacterium]|nr:minor capsid protein [Alphaproteobacteria bacterium]MBQ3946345.1 minor capsid protein [Alphaproteobacteria bacterium]